MRIVFGLLLLCVLPLQGQESGPVESESRMLIPPPVSARAYPTAVGSEVRSNFMTVGGSIEGAYIDNLLPGSTATPLAEKTLTLRPDIQLDQQTSRWSRSFSYSPGFTFYQPTSSLNQIEQHAIADIQYRPSPHTVVSLSDMLDKSATSFTFAGAENGVSGAIPASVLTTLAPGAQQLLNTASGEFAWQLSPASMIGAEGSYALLHYTDKAQVTGLYDYTSPSESAFYNRRVSEKQYLGVIYQHSETIANPEHRESKTAADTFDLFYSAYPLEHLSFSVAAGPQHYLISFTGVPDSSAWGPAVVASMGWQGERTSFSASFSRAVSGGGGLLGAYRSTTADGTGRWQMSRTWVSNVNAAYVLNNSVDQTLSLGLEGGHTISGGAGLEHRFGRQLRLEFQYDHAHQSYAGIPAVVNNPDTNREMVSVTWQLVRPLGR